MAIAATSEELGSAKKQQRKTYKDIATGATVQTIGGHGWSWTGPGPSWIGRGPDPGLVQNWSWIGPGLVVDRWTGHNLDS